MIIARHLIKGTPEARLSEALGREVEYAPACGWPADCVVQWGNGIVPANPFFEAFPAGGGFIRGDGDSLLEAERRAFAQFEREHGCAHFWSRWHVRRGTYFNGGGNCRKCSAFRGSVFKEVVVLGHWRQPLKRWERDHLISVETNDDGMNEWMAQKYPEAVADRARYARLLRLRLNLFGVDEASSRLSLFG